MGGSWKVRSVAVGGACALTLGLAAPSLAAGGFVHRADQACTAAGRKVEKLSRNVTVQEVEQEAKIVSGLARQLGTLTPPASDAKLFKLFIKETKAQVTDVNDVLAAARHNDKSKTERDLNKLDAAGNAANATAKALGLTACAKNYSPKGAS